MGYHSPTEWIFFPNVVALYESIIINKVVYEETISRGQSSPSGYEYRKAIILEELKQSGKLRPMSYDISDREKEKLSTLIGALFKNYPNKIGELSANAYDAFCKHEIETINYLASPSDPHYVDVEIQVQRLKKEGSLLKQNVPLSSIPHLKNIITPYFEDVFFSPLISPSSYNPIFQWEGYAPFEEWILGLREDKSEAYERIKKGTQYKVLSAFAEIAIPARPPLKDANDAYKVMEKWDDFQPVRELIDKTNKEIWSEIETINQLDDTEIPEFVQYFEDILRSRMSNINNQIRLVDNYIERKKCKSSWKILRAMILTIGSLVPGTGGLESLLEYIYQKFIGQEIKADYPNFSGLFEYERILNSLSLSKEPIPPVVSVSKPYIPISYWDEKPP